MNGIETPKRWRGGSELRVALFFAALMLALPLGAKVAARWGLGDALDLKQRALMVVMAGFIMVTGNTIPKRVTAWACRNLDAARLQSFHRFAGWTWVLTGLAFGLAWLLLPLGPAGTATLVILPAGMALIALRWWTLASHRRPAA